MRKHYRIASSILLLCLALFLAGCPVGTPHFSVYPLAFDFGNGLNSDTMFLSYQGGEGAVNWTLGPLPAWLSATPLSGATSQLDRVTLSVDRSKVTQENGTSEFLVNSSMGAFTVHVSAAVITDDGGGVDPGEKPVLLVTADSTADDGTVILQMGKTDETEKFFTVANSGTGVLNWWVDNKGEFPEWLKDGVKFTGGSIGNTPKQVNVTVNRDVLPFGTSEFVMKIASNGGKANLAIRVVREIVSIIGAAPTEMNFNIGIDTDIIGVANYAPPGDRLDFIVTSDQPWLLVSPSTGTSAGFNPPDFPDTRIISIAVNRACLTTDAAGGALTVAAFKMVDGQMVVRSEVDPVTISVTVERPPMSIESAVPWGVYPSKLRFPFILRAPDDRGIRFPEPVTQDVLDAFGKNVSIFEEAILLESTETGLRILPDVRANIVIMLDYSGSMHASANSITPANGGPIALQQLYEQTVIPNIIDNLADLGPDTNIALMAFFTRNQEDDYGISPWLVPFPASGVNDRGVLKTALQNFAPPITNGATEILPNVAKAVAALINQEGPNGFGPPSTGFDSGVINIVLLVSDGRQTTSSLKLTDVTDLARNNLVRCFTTSWGNEPNSGLLGILASSTLGQFYSTSSLCLRDANGDPIPPTGTGPTVTSLDLQLALTSYDLGSHYLMEYTTLNEGAAIPVRWEGRVTRPDGKTVSGTTPEYKLDLDVLAPGVPPTLFILRPAASDQWAVGTTHDILWTKLGKVGDVTLYLLKGNTILGEINPTDKVNDGKFTWTLPAQLNGNMLQTSNDYSVMIMHTPLTGDVVFAQSDPFRIL